MLNSIINSKKIMNDIVKDFYKEKKKAINTEYNFNRLYAYKTIDNYKALLMVGGHAIYKVFRDELPFEFKETKLKIGDVWNSVANDKDYKKAVSIEKVIKTVANKENTLLKLKNESGENIYINNALLKYFDGKKVAYSYWVKDYKSPVLIKVDGEFFGFVCPVCINGD